MTHPVYAAIARERARFADEANRLAVRIVTDLHAVAASSDRAAAEVVARLEHLDDKGRPADAYRAGVIVAEYLGITDDYEASAWARRYGRALLAARRALDEHTPTGDRLAFSPDVEADVVEAVQIARAASHRLIVIDPTRRHRQEDPRG